MRKRIFVMIVACAVLIMTCGTTEIIAKKVSVVFNKKNFPSKDVRKNIAYEYELGETLKKIDLEYMEDIDLVSKKQVDYRGVEKLPYLCEMSVTERGRKGKLPILPKLKMLSYTNPVIKKMQFPAYKKLERLEIYGKNMKELQLPKASKLKGLTLCTPKLEKIDLSLCPQLEDLELDGLKIPIDFSQVEDVNTLTIIKSNVEHLDVSKFNFLDKIQISDCDNLQSITLKNGNIEQIVISECDKLQCVDASGCKKLKNINLKCNPLLSQVLAKESSGLKTLKISQCKEITNLDEISLANLKEIGITNTSVDAISPEMFPKVRQLTFGQNSQESIDFSKLRQLTSLHIVGEKKTKVLDVSKMEKLCDLSWTQGVLQGVKWGKKERFQDIDLSQNRLFGEWDLSKFKNVDLFNCNNNKITSLSLGKSGKDWNIQCRNNCLKKIDASYAYNLSVLDCRGNRKVKILMLSDDSECRTWRWDKSAKVKYRYKVEK